MTDTPTDNARTQGKIAWFANRKTGNTYLSTPNRGRVFVLGASRSGTLQAQDHQPGCDGNCRGCGVMKPIHAFGEADHNGEVRIDHPDLNHLAMCWNTHEELLQTINDVRHLNQSDGRNHREIESLIIKALANLPPTEESK